MEKEARYQTEPLRNLYEGIFAKTFTLFYGETLRYYFKAEIGDKVTQTQERVITMNKVEGTPVSKYQMIESDAFRSQTGQGTGSAFPDEEVFQTGTVCGKYVYHKKRNAGSLTRT